jgi:hypothetical protein
MSSAQSVVACDDGVVSLTFADDKSAQLPRVTDRLKLQGASNRSDGSGADISPSRLGWKNAEVSSSHL